MSDNSPPPVARLVAWIALAIGFAAAAMTVILAAGGTTGTNAMPYVSGIISAVALVLSAVAFIGGRQRDETVRTELTVKASGGGAVAAGRDAVGNAQGQGSVSALATPGAPVESPASASPPDSIAVEASGDRSIAVGRDAQGNAIGDASEVS